MSHGGIGEFPANRFRMETGRMPIRVWGGDRQPDPSVPPSGLWPLKRAIRETISYRLGPGGIEMRKLASSFSKLGA